MKQGQEVWEPYTREYPPETPTRPYPTIWNDLHTMRQAKAQLREMFNTADLFEDVRNKPRAKAKLDRMLAENSDLGKTYVLKEELRDIYAYAAEEGKARTLLLEWIEKSRASDVAHRAHSNCAAQGCNPFLTGYAASRDSTHRESGDPVPDIAEHSAFASQWFDESTSIGMASASTLRKRRGAHL